MLGRCGYLEVITGSGGSGSHTPTYALGLDPTTSSILHPVTVFCSWLLKIQAIFLLDINAIHSTFA